MPDVYDCLPSEQEIALWEEQRGKRPFNGIGNLFRQYSQYRLMRDWENRYKFKTALEMPYDRATDGIDGNIFSCAHVAYDESVSPASIPPCKAEFVWNFGFLQREPYMIKEMRRISTKYVAAFVPNWWNIGTSVHKIYHWMYGGTCNHPERGDRRLMGLHGIRKLFKENNILIIESGYIDIPPFPDTVVTVKEFFGSKSRDVLKIPVDVKKLLPFEQIAHPHWIWAHHCYILGVKR